MPSKITRNLRSGDVIRHEQAGGGGYGEPFARDPLAVVEDVRNEKISTDFAREKFGVVIAADGASIDMAATELRRQELRQEKALK